MINSYSNYEWFMGKDLSEYSGKWVAIIDKEIIAADKNVTNVLKEAKNKYPNKRPLVTKIKNKLSIL